MARDPLAELPEIAGLLAALEHGPPHPRGARLAHEIRQLLAASPPASGKASAARPKLPPLSIRFPGGSNQPASILFSIGSEDGGYQPGTEAVCPKCLRPYR